MLLYSSLLIDKVDWQDDYTNILQESIPIKKNTPRGCNMWNENIGQGRTSYVLLKSMKAILILMKESAISLRAAEPDANCFWIPLQYWTTQVNIIKLKKGPKFLSNNDAKYISHLYLQILLEIIYLFSLCNDMANYLAIHERTFLH